MPADASVAASRNALTPFSRRERVYRFPNLGDAEYVLLDFRELRHPAAWGLDGGVFGRLAVSTSYRMVDAAGGAVLFAGGDPTEPRAGAAQARLGDWLELIEHRLHPIPSQGALDVTLVWRALARPPGQFTVFVHLVDLNGARVAQADSPPADGLLPTDTWLPGRAVVDTHTLVLPEDGVPARSTLQIGAYDPRDGRRLAVTARALPGGPDWLEVRPASSR